ncbi:hypothetical protein PR048_002651 [Dryococelus australis]|uniref:Uncharacterized protein n=1 Tax=Dryococelus australis TaxID=614101 RepID=A0ABQ9IKR1_9NEOP|nr:hypothetical protein PR048_002651 [Dryococelus australis]
MRKAWPQEGAAAVQWLDCYPPPPPPRRTELNPRPGHRIFASMNRAGRCRWLAGFLGISHSCRVSRACRPPFLLLRDPECDYSTLKEVFLNLVSGQPPSHKVSSIRAPQSHMQRYCSTRRHPGLLLIRRDAPLVYLITGNYIIIEILRLNIPATTPSDVLSSPPANKISAATEFCRHHVRDFSLPAFSNFLGCCSVENVVYFRNDGRTANSIGERHPVLYNLADPTAGHTCAVLPHSPESDALSRLRTMRCVCAAAAKRDAVLTGRAQQIVVNARCHTGATVACGCKTGEFQQSEDTRIGVGECWVHAQKTNKRSTSSLFHASIALQSVTMEVIDDGMATAYLLHDYRQGEEARHLRKNILSLHPLPMRIIFFSQVRAIAIACGTAKNLVTYLRLERQMRKDLRPTTSGTSYRRSQELHQAPVVERLACSPPTKANRVQSPTGPLPDLRKWKSYLTMPLIGLFSQGSRVSPVLAFQRCSVLTSFHPSSALKTSLFLLRAPSVYSIEHPPAYLATIHHTRLTVPQARVSATGRRLRSTKRPAGWRPDAGPFGGWMAARCRALRRLDGSKMLGLRLLDDGKMPGLWRLDGGKTPGLRLLDGGKTPGLRRLDDGKTPMPGLWRLDVGKMPGLRRLDVGKMPGLRLLDDGKMLGLRLLDGGKMPGLRLLDDGKTPVCGGWMAARCWACGCWMAARCWACGCWMAARLRACGGWMTARRRPVVAG